MALGHRGVNHRWPNLQELIDCDGDITIGYVAPVGGVASATEGKQVYAMLRIAGGELLPDILDRLDAAVSKAIEDEIFTDEINR